MQKLKSAVLFLIWIFLALFQAQVYGQSLEKQQTIPLTTNKISFLEIDNLGYLYTIQSQGIIEKRNLQGKVLFSINNKMKGTVSRLDVMNPMRILVHYSDINTVQILDNTLSLIKEFDFTTIGFTQVLSSCSSRNSGLWFFDGSTYKIHRLNDNGKIDFSSEMLNNLLQSPPNYMVETSQRLWVSNGTCILEFDAMGTFMRKYEQIQVSSFQVFNQILAYQQDSNFCYFDIETLQENRVPLHLFFDTDNIKDAKIFKQQLFVLLGKEIFIFKTI